MKYLIGAICAIVITMAFSGRKCEHVFTSVEQANIKAERVQFFVGGYMVMPQQPTGIHEGKELICVKCFHVQKQILDYGKPEYAGPALTSLPLDTCMFLKGGNLVFDTAGIILLK